jgi:hypothetical protein
MLKYEKEFTFSLRAIASRLGISEATLKRRLQAGWFISRWRRGKTSPFFVSDLVLPYFKVIPKHGRKRT